MGARTNQRHLSRTELADGPRRSELWKLLPKSYREELLERLERSQEHAPDKAPVGFLFPFGAALRV